MATRGELSSMLDIGKMDHDKFIKWLEKQTFWPYWRKDEFFGPLRKVEYNGRMFCDRDGFDMRHRTFLDAHRDNPEGWFFFNFFHLPILKGKMVALFPGFESTGRISGGMQPGIQPVIPDLFREARNGPKWVSDYTDFKISTLPFFAPKELRPQRFHFVDEDTFEYYGREAFKQLVHMGDMMNTSTNRKLYLHGTMGTGKSIYWLHCRMVAVRPRPTIRNALLLAFSDLPGILEKITAIKTDDELENFCDEISPDHTIYWLIDQANALDPADPTEDRISNSQKEHTRAILDSITTNHIKIQSGSGNYGHGLGDMCRESSEDLMPFSGGFRRTELDKWWASSEFGSKWSDLLGEEGRMDIEAFTGCPPMLLAVVRQANPDEVPKGESSDGETIAAQGQEDAGSNVPPGGPTDVLGEEDPGGPADSMKPDKAAARATKYLLKRIQDSEQLRTMAQMVHAFSIKMRENVTNTVEEINYTTAIDNCLTQSSVDVSAQGLFDHRFQYRKGTRGQIAGGIAMARAFSRILRDAQAGALFIGVRWFDSLMPGLSRPVLRFVVEQMSLSYIAVHGLTVIDMPTGCPSTTFLGESPPLQLHREQFAIPTIFNYANVDAIYWRRLDGDGDAKPRILIAGIQHTLQRWSHHSSAEHPFFRHAKNWLEALNWEGEFVMAWIVEKRFPGDQAMYEIEEETEEHYNQRLVKAIAKCKAKEALKRKAKELKLASLTGSEAGPSTRPDKGKGKARDVSPMALEEEQEDEPVTISRTPAYTRYVVEIREFSDRIARKLAAVRGDKYKPAALENPKKTGKGKKPAAKRAPRKNTRKPPGKPKGKGDKGDDQDSDDGDGGKLAARGRAQRTQKAVPTEQDHGEGGDGPSEDDNRADSDDGDTSEEDEEGSEYDGTNSKKPKPKAKAKVSAAAPQKRPRPDDEDDDAGPSRKKPKSTAKAPDARQTRGSTRKQGIK